MKAAKLVRRKFFSTAAMGLMSASSLSAAPAVESTDEEKANIQIVNDFCAAWSTRDITKPLRFLAADSVYRMTQTTPPAKGPNGVVERLKSYVDDSERVEFKVIETFAKGPIVMNHRIDTFASKTRPITWEGVGVFLVQDGKIKEWSDYTIRVVR